jgi:flagellar motor switch protein FliG
MASTNNTDDEGLEDAAILLMSLGEEEAAEVFKHLAPKEVQRLGETIARMRAIPRERIERVIDSFTELAAKESILVADSNEYVKSVLRKALGEDKANLLIDRILQGSDITGIESATSTRRSWPPSWCTWTSTSAPTCSSSSPSASATRSWCASPRSTASSPRRCAT